MKISHNGWAQLSFLRAHLGRGPLVAMLVDESVAVEHDDGTVEILWSSAPGEPRGLLFLPDASFFDGYTDE